MPLLWKRFRIATRLPADEVQARLATATADWGGDFRGRAVPPPSGDRAGPFVACQGVASFGFSVPLVIVGEVRQHAGGAEVSALVRPHGFDITASLAVSAFPALWNRITTTGLLLSAAVALAAAALLAVNLSEKTPAIQDLFAAACDGGSITSSR